MTDERADRNAKMRKLYEDEEWTLAELGDEFGLHQGTVWGIAHRAGWKMRKAAPFTGRGRYWDAPVES